MFYLRNNKKLITYYFNYNVFIKMNKLNQNKTLLIVSLLILSIISLIYAVLFFIQADLTDSSIKVNCILKEKTIMRCAYRHCFGVGLKSNCEIRQGNKIIYKYMINDDNEDCIDKNYIYHTECKYKPRERELESQKVCYVNDSCKNPTFNKYSLKRILSFIFFSLFTICLIFDLILINL